MSKMTSKSQERLSVFSYKDYRVFLLDYYELRKKGEPSFSYNVWARSLGLKNNTSIIKIVKGQRRPGEKFITSLVRYLKLDSMETEYLKGLVEIEKADSHQKIEVTKRLSRLNYQKNLLSLDLKSFDSIASLWNFALRQLARWNLFPRDAKDLKKILIKKFTVEDIRARIDLLKETNMLKVEENKYSCPKLSVKLGGDVVNEAVKQGHIEGLDLAKELLYQVPKNEREFGSVTFAFSKDDMKEAKEMIQNFQVDFAAR